MSVHLRERELLAQLVAVAVVRLDVDRPLVKECFIQTVEPFADGLLVALDLRDPLPARFS